MKKEGVTFFILISVAYIILNYLTNTYILTNKFYENALAYRISYDRIVYYLGLRSKLEITSYVLIPIVFFIKSFYTALCLYVSFFLKDLDVPFSKVLTTSIKAETIFLCAALIRFTYFFIFPPNEIIDLNNYSLFSIAEILDTKKWEKYLYILQTINVFEIVYVFVLYLDVKKNNKKCKFKYVFIGYSVGLFIISITVMFFQTIVL